MDDPKKEKELHAIRYGFMNRSRALTEVADCF